MIRLAISICSVLFLLLALLWLGRDKNSPIPASPASNPAGPVVLRMGVIPELDLVAQRARYRALADVLGTKLGGRVELVTVSGYQDIVKDFESGQIDCAFLGSLVAVLSHDRMGAQIVAKSETPAGLSSYRGVIFVKEDSPIRSVGDLAGKSLALVHGTLGGHLFPMDELYRAGLLKDKDQVKLVFFGTHEEAILAVSKGVCDAGATKNLRMDAFEKANPQVKIRRIIESQSVPDNALALRRGFDPQAGIALTNILLNLHNDSAGRLVLTRFGLRQFLPCDISEFAEIYRLSADLAPVWDRTQIGGAAPGINKEGTDASP